MEIQKNPRITHHIDWLQYSVDWPDFVWEWPLHPAEGRDIVRACIPHLPVLGVKIERPNDYKPFGMAGYSLIYDMLYCTAHVNPQRRDMKVGVRMTGKELGVWRDFGGDDKRLATFVRGVKGSTSRVDIAFDVWDYGVEPMQIYRDWKGGKVQSQGRKATPLTSGVMGADGKVSEATTVYFGSRTSETMIRVYEKGKEQQTDLDWVRFEIELKGDKAKVVMADIDRLGAGVVGKQILRDYFPKMPYKFWKQLTHGESVELTSVGRKATERQSWLLNVIFPLIAEEIANEWEGTTETGITRAVEALTREHWRTRAIAIQKQYGRL